MARLQDFPSVTPTSSDKILIVQSQGQGLAPHTIKLDSANPTGTGSLSLNRKSGTTTGSKSVAVGDNSTASGSISTAMGSGTTASGNYSFAAGSTSTASGNISTAFGSGTTASGAISFASGISTTASGDRSQAMGTGTIANHMAQHAFGEWNVADASTAAASSRGNYVEIVGNGSNNANRSNARTLDWSGNEVLAGDLTINDSQSLTQHIGNLRTQIITGGTRWKAQASGESGVNAPYSILIFGYRSLHIASAVNISSDLNDLYEVYRIGTSLTLTDGVLEVDTTNRLCVCIMPNTVKLVQVTT